MTALSAAAAFLAAALALAQSPPTHQHSFGDAEKWAHVFDDPERDAWQKPHEVIQALGLKPDAATRREGLGNMIAVAGTAESPRLPAKVDLALRSA